jgi:hemerythrin superfamily protein
MEMDMNPLVNRVTPGITAMIRMDHSHVLALLRRYKPDISRSRKEALVTNACLALQIHAQLEEELFYPGLRTLMGDDPVLQKSGPEHDEMRGLIDELRRRISEGAVEDPAFDKTFLELMRVVIHHVADEETQLLPAADRLWGDRLVELGGEMTRRRMELMKPHATTIALSAARSFPAGTALLAAGALAIGVALLPRARKPRRRLMLRR